MFNQRRRGGLQAIRGPCAVLVLTVVEFVVVLWDPRCQRSAMYLCSSKRLAAFGCAASTTHKSVAPLSCHQCWEINSAACIACLQHTL